VVARVVARVDARVDVANKRILVCYYPVPTLFQLAPPS
jgi:hypothetical protein